MVNDPRLDHEREALQNDYETRRAGMLRLAIIMGVIVILALMAMFLGILALSSGLDNLKNNQTDSHSCTVSLIDQVLLGTHNTHPIGCPQGSGIP